MTTVDSTAPTQTCDVEGLPLAVGDRVEVTNMDDPNLHRYVGKVADVEWVQDVPPFAQVILVFNGSPDDPDYPPMSTFAAWVRKVADHA